MVCLILHSGAAACRKGFVICFSESSTGCWAVLQMPCCLSKQGELSENIKQNIFYKLPLQAVHVSQTDALYSTYSHLHDLN